MTHAHLWQYINHVTVPFESEPYTMLLFVCDCGAMKRSRGFDYTEPPEAPSEPTLPKKRMGRPPKQKGDV